MTKTVIMNVTPRLAQVTVAQEAASAILNSLKAKKTDKVSKMSPTVELVSVAREGKAIKVNVKNEDREGMIKLTSEKITDGNTVKNIKPAIAEEFDKMFDDIDLDKFGEVVVAKANKVIETAVKLSKAAPSNPNLFRPAKKTAKAEDLPF